MRRMYNFKFNLIEIDIIDIDTTEDHKDLVVVEFGI